MRIKQKVRVTKAKENNNLIEQVQRFKYTWEVRLQATMVNAQ